MYGDELQKAINIINQYLKSNNTIYLYDKNKEGDDDATVLKLHEGSDLSFVLYKWED